MLPIALFVVAQASAASNQVTTADFEEATKVLRLAGLQFPGDGEYRTVTLELLTFRFGPSEIKLNGWIVADEYTGKKSFLAWNGLTYDDFEIGPAASVEEDLKRGKAIVEAKTADFSAEYRAAMYPTSTIAALLLHSLGLEERAVAAALRPSFTPTKGGLVTTALQHFDQILTTSAAIQIKFGRYEEAYLQTRSLRRFRNLFDEVLEAKGVRLRRIQRKGLSNHWIIDGWLDDLRRRIVDAKTPEMSLQEIAKLPQDQQIEALVQRLDDSIGQFYIIQGSTARAPLSPDRMLEKFGQAAVDALIPHMNDQDMSRSMDLLFPMRNDATFATTGSVSSKLVQSALGLSPLPRMPGRYDHDLELIQRYWDSVHGLPSEEQWLRALEFDDFGPLIWESAARNLSIPPWVTIRGASGRSMTNYPLIEVTTPRHRWGDLDQRAHDRVVRALELRIRNILDEKKASTLASRQPYTLAVALAAWDLEASIPFVQEVLRLYLTQELSALGGATACALASVLICAGDESGWDIYEALLEKIPRDSRSDYDKLFAPLWQHYDNPRAKQIAQRIFSGDDGWNATMIVARSRSRIPTVALRPEFKHSLLAGLDDTEVATTATRVDKARIRYPKPTGGFASRSTNPVGTSVPVGGEFDVRWCDLLAIRLAGFTISFGGFDAGWPVERRDAFISDLKNGMAREDFDWATLHRDVRPIIFTYDPVFATSLPPRPKAIEVDRFGIRPQFEFVEPGIVTVGRLGSSQDRKFGRWGGIKSRRQ